MKIKKTILLPHTYYLCNEDVRHRQRENCPYKRKMVE